MQRNLLLFIFICFPVRVSLVIGSYFIENESTITRTPFVIAAALVALGFFRAHYVDNPTGAFGGEKYWNSLAHGMLYVLYAIFLGIGTNVAYVVLGIDIIFGIINVMVNYYP